MRERLKIGLAFVALVYLGYLTYNLYINIDAAKATVQGIETELSKLREDVSRLKAQCEAQTNQECEVVLLAQPKQ